MSDLDQRVEQRLPMESSIIPFLGSREEDYQPFEYLLQDFSRNGVRVAIPSWVHSREKLYKDDRVNLHLPYKIKGQSRNRGIVAWEGWDKDADAQVCGISLDTYFPETYPVFISLDTKEIIVDLENFDTMDQLLLLIMKDCVLLKRGMLIHFNHLIAYFTRVSGFRRKDYSAFRDTIMGDIRSELQIKHDYLKSIYLSAMEMEKQRKDILTLLDMGELKKSIESQLYIDLFGALASFEIISRYLMALKTLEKKSYTNYNTLAMLYLRSFY